MFHEHHKPAVGVEENPRANVAWEQLVLARKTNQVSFVEPMDNPKTAEVEAGFDNRVTSASDTTTRVVVKSAARERFDIEAGKAKIFFSIYFCMTGLHGIHVIIRIGIAQCRLGGLGSHRCRHGFGFGYPCLLSQWCNERCRCNC